MTRTNRATRLAAAFAAALLLCAAVRAQSTIVNIPSTEVPPPGGVYVEAGYTAHLAGLDKGGEHSFSTLILYGLRRNVEVGVNAYYTKAGGPQPVVVEPNVKWQFYANEEKGVALAAGGLLSVPLTRRSEERPSGMLYVTASKSLRAAFGPKLTGGAYLLAGPGRGEGNRGGALFGIEQPFFKRVSLVADWYTGRNGYYAAGFVLPVGRRGNLSANYSFGNGGRGKNYLSVSYGRSF